MDEFPLFQQFSFCILNFCYLVYMMVVKPLEDPSANHMEIFNESMILVVNYHLFLFHFFNDDPTSAYTVGWSCILIMITMMLVNVVVVLAKSFKGIRLFIKRIIMRLRLRKPTAIDISERTPSSRSLIMNSPPLILEPIEE